MSIRLNKALRELNIGFQTAVEFLSKKSELGEVTADPNFKLSDEQYKALNAAFSQDKEVRNQAEKLFPKKTKDKKRAPEQNDNRAESILPSSGQQQYKPLGKIDLDSIGKAPAAKSAAPVETKKEEAAAVSHAPVNNASKANDQMKQNDEKDMQSQANDNQPKQVAQPAETNASGSVFTLKSEKKYSSNEPKVLGKIDLASLNQSTRPKKKSKEERRKEREEKLAQQHSERKKRVRINKERVDINAEANQNNGGKNGGNQNTRMVAVTRRKRTRTKTRTATITTSVRLRLTTRL